MLEDNFLVFLGELDRIDWKFAVPKVHKKSDLCILLFIFEVFLFVESVV